MCCPTVFHSLQIKHISTRGCEQMPSNSFQPILDEALADYSKQVGIDLATHPLSNGLRSCTSPNAVLKILEDKAKEFKEFREGNRKLINWLKPVVHIVYTFSAVLSASLTLVSRNSSLHFLFSPVLLIDPVQTSKCSLRWRRYPRRGTHTFSVSTCMRRVVFTPCYRRPVASARAMTRSSTCSNVLALSSNAFESIVTLP